MYRCIMRKEGKSGKVETYVLKNIDNSAEIVEINANELKSKIHNGIIQVENLTLTSDNKLRRKGEIQYKSYKKSEINKDNCIMVINKELTKYLNRVKTKYGKLKTVYNNTQNRQDKIVCDSMYKIDNKNIQGGVLHIIIKNVDKESITIKVGYVSEFKNGDRCTNEMKVHSTNNETFEIGITDNSIKEAKQIINNTLNKIIKIIDKHINEIKTMRNNIKTRLKYFCNSYGELYYEKIEHKTYNYYKDLDIITKKNLTNKLQNTVILLGYGYGRFRALLIGSKDINFKLENYDRTYKGCIGGKGPIWTLKVNDILRKEAVWYKLYDKDKNIINIDEILKEKYSEVNLIAYFERTLIRYAMENNIGIPMSDSDYGMIKMLADMNKQFTDEEHIFARDNLWVN